MFPPTVVLPRLEAIAIRLEVIAIGNKEEKIGRKVKKIYMYTSTLKGWLMDTP